MQYHLAVDSGGSKVLAILYDDTFTPVRSCRVGSMRPNTTPGDIIRKNVSELFDKLQLDGMTLGYVNGVIDQDLSEALKTRCTVETWGAGGEGNLGMCAAETVGDACLALAGTGATFFYYYQGRFDTAGGYGSSIADEGSGYWIGKEAFLAAIHDYEGRGPHTMLTDLICERLEATRDTLRGQIFDVIYRVNAHISPVAQVAACAPLVTQAVYAGDAVAQDILNRAGYQLGEQLAMMQRKHHLPADLPIALSGSVWRSHPMLLESFTRTLREMGVTGEIRVPAYEPIVGAIIQHFYAVRGSFTDADRAHFAKHYSEYTFQLAK